MDPESVVLVSTSTVGSQTMAVVPLRASEQVNFAKLNSGTPVSEALPVGFDRDRRLRHEIVGNEDVLDVRVVDAQHQDHRRRLRTVVKQLVADPDVHGLSSLSACSSKRNGVLERDLGTYDRLAPSLHCI